jgi:ribosomal protein S18 acetylase RimI-like enzyme
MCKDIVPDYLKDLSYRHAETADFDSICHLPQSAEELFFMSPKAEYPLTKGQLELATNSRFDPTVVLLDNEIVGFANFYEKEENRYCSIGNVVVSSLFRNRGIGTFLIQAMEHIALEKYNVSETHISCFNTNTKGILLYSKLGYTPYIIERRITSQGKLLALIKFKKAIR